MNKKVNKTIAIVSLGLALFGSGSVFAYSAGSKTVSIKDGGAVKEYKTNADTVGKLLEENNITISSQDSMNKTAEGKIKDGDTITISRATPVVVTLDGVPRMEQTNEKTVGAFLKSMKKQLGSNYILQDNKEYDSIQENMTIALLSTKERTVITRKTIPFTTEIKENPNQPVGTETVLQQGVNGESEVIKIETYAGSKLVSTREAEPRVSKQPVNAILERGTAKPVVQQKAAPTMQQTTFQGANAKAMRVKATGYTPYDEGCNGVTASGMPAKKGVIAVDKRVIPFGTKVYVPGYGYAVAGDTGGAIKGNRIDLCYDSKAEAFGWGVRDVTIYILD